MPEKIDSLTLDVGLTSEEFQAGVDKILGSMNRMESTAAETGESMGASLATLGTSVAGLAWRFAGMFLAFKSIEGLVDYFKDLSHELADLGFAARYLGQSGIELRRFGEVAELAGGQSHDAISAVRGLESAIFGLEFQGQMSQNLLMLQRLGIGYLNLQGQLRPLKEIALETAAALEKQLPGEGNRAMRVQWAAQIFGPGGLANAVGDGVKELRKFYSESAADNKKITDASINRQMQLQQSLTGLSYQVKGEAAAILDKLTPAIRDLIKAIETKLIPTIDELISDVMDWLHPERLVDKAMSSPEGVGPIGLKHPINTFEAIGIGLGIRAGQFHEWWQENLENFRRDKLAKIAVPPQVASRLPPNVNLDALKLLHMEAGGDEGDATWSKAIAAYGSLGGPKGAAAYVTSATATGQLAPSTPNAGALSTPSTARPPASSPGAAGTKPTASLTGPRVQIGSIGPIITQATDAGGLMADLNRAAQRKLLVAQADPGLA